MNAEQAKTARPLINKDAPYVPTGVRTKKDDLVSFYDAHSKIRYRTLLSETEFERIYRTEMKFFRETESLQYKLYQSGEKKPQDFYEECARRLRKDFPKEMSSSINFNAMMKRIDMAMFHYDVLQPLIDDPDTTDIKVSSYNDIRVRVKGEAYSSNVSFLDEQDLFQFVYGLGIRNGIDILKLPIVTFTDKHDENYILRFTVSAPCINAVDYPYLHIRKVSKKKPDWDELIRRGVLTPDVKAYLIDKTKTARAVVFAGPPGCVDADTEYFNGECWKPISEYTEGERVLQFDIETKSASLVLPEKYVKLSCEEMFHFETKYGINQTISEEHRVLYVNKTHIKGEKTWSHVVKEMSGSEFVQKQNDGHFHGGFLTTFGYSGGGIPLFDVEIELMLAVICDGTLNKKGVCTVNVKKQAKKDAMKDILERSGIPYTYHEYPNGYARFRFIPPIAVKIFPSEWYNCSVHQFEIICKNICKWDGHIGKNGRLSYFSTKKENADFIQFAFASIGKRATIQKDERKGQSYKTGGKEYTRVSDSYSVYVANNNIVGMAFHNDGRNNNPVVRTVKTTDGYKYCFTVPTHALVLRRKGNIFITGNSGKTTGLNAFIEHIPKTRETLVIQENDELFTDQPGFMFKHVSNGFRGEPVCTLETLARMALVEGCNEIVVGEVKGGEMRHVMTLLNSGGYGALTVHANSVYQILPKLADLVKYGSDYSYEDAKKMLESVDVLVYMEGYKIREIVEVDGYDPETKDYNYIPIYRYGI